jgi:hypothetical protein
MTSTLRIAFVLTYLAAFITIIDATTGDHLLRVLGGF